MDLQIFEMGIKKMKPHSGLRYNKRKTFITI